MPGSSLYRNTLKMSSSNVLMYFVPVIVTPILTRLFAQEAFGEWGVFSSVIAILGVGMFWGYENAIVKAHDEADARHTGLLCILTSSITLLLTALVFTVGSAAGLPFFQSFPEKGLLFAYLVVYALYIILYNFCNRQEKYNVLAISHVILGGSQAVLRITFGLIALTAVNGLILGTMLAQVLNVLFILFCLYEFLKVSNWKGVSLQRIKELFRLNSRFPLFDAPASVMAFAAFQSPTLILSQYFSKADIGCFSIVIQLLLMPMSFIGTAMGKVYYQQLCRAQGNKAAIQEVSQKVVNTVCVISILPLLFLAAGGDYVLVKFLGDKWTTAGNVALCLALWSFPTVLSQPLIPLYRTLDKQKNLLIFNAFYFIGGVGAITLGCLTTKNLYLILLSFSLVTAVCKFCMFSDLLRLCELRFRNLNKYALCIWTVSLVLLCFRLAGILSTTDPGIGFHSIFEPFEHTTAQ